MAGESGEGGGVTRLFLETSTPRASLALWRDGAVVFEESFISDRSHNALLFEPLQRALRVLGEERLAGVVIGTGPGSYSGTRVGIAAGQGVAMVHGCPVAGLSSLLAAPAVLNGALAVGDARRGSGWYVEISPGMGKVEPVLVDVAGLADRIGEALEEGRAVFSLEPVGRMGLPGELAEAVRAVVPDAAGLARAWEGLDEKVKRELEGEAVQPVYLRPPHVTEAKAGHPLLRKGAG